MYSTNEDLLNIINNLLGVYSLELGEKQVEKEFSNINKIINDAIRSIKRLADEKNDKIILSTQEKLSEIKMDPDEIKRVFVNLISNAIKHNPEGISIKISAEQKENEILLSISDNALGIPEPEKELIFQRFPRGKRKIGSGLGLYLSKQIVGLHGGKIWFESEEGKGTTFYFTLPI
jgi:signal transduction histidine kinase